jgi:predicted nucleic acid-binding protein
MIVLDASALVEWLLRTQIGLKVESRIFAPSARLHVPHLVDVEVVQVLRRLVREKMLTDVRAEEALEDLDDLAGALGLHQNVQAHAAAAKGHSAAGANAERRREAQESTVTRTDG